MKQNEKIILASQSPRRKQLLEQMGLHLTIQPSEIAEVGYGGIPEKIPARIVLQKMKAVKAIHGMNLEGYILAADTIVAFENEVYGKPENIEHARTMLQDLSGKTHQVYTCFRIEDLEGDFIEKTVMTSVRMKTIPADQIEWYVTTSEPFDKAGAYALQGMASTFIESIQGSYTNVIGLPLMEVTDALVKLKIISF